jgi:hypothetical protein
MFRRLLLWAAGAVAASLLLGLALPSRAGIKAVTPNSASPEAAAAVRDLGLTIQARRILLQDPELGPLNLGVRVRNRVAILWGPVPSVEMGFKAEVCLRSFVELAEVRNELLITGDDTPAQDQGPRSAPLFLPLEPRPAIPALAPEAAPGLRPRPAVVAPRQSSPPPPPDQELEPLPQRLPRPKGPASGG